MLAPYACFAIKSKGGFYKEEKDPYRTCFQRDRDRIIHTNAFRRLKRKTQVFVANHGDHYRTRLTHSMEVAQISRDISRSLGLNEDLSESIALAHDLGHTPFGHAGEHALNLCLKKFGESFEHNKQSLRIVTEIENRNDSYPGLNLSKEVIEGLGKHETPYDKIEKQNGALSSLEAQVVNIADEIAYLSHDLDDGMGANILNIKDIKNLDLWKESISKVKNVNNKGAWVSRIAGSLIHIMVTDVYEETQIRLNKNNVKNFEDIAKCKVKIIAFSKDFYDKKEILRKFLFNNFYKHPEIEVMNKKGQKIITSLFDFFLNNPKKLPDEYQKQINERELYLILRDYIAGMTDDYANEQYLKFTK